MISTILFIGIGGFAGTVLRYLVSKYFNIFINSFPLGTLCVNVLGSFVLGFIVYTLAGSKVHSDVRDFITIGLIGGFTTMSSFAYESIKLLELSQYLFFCVNVVLNVMLCLIAVYLGRELSLFLNR